MSLAKKYYAVKHGRKSGVYETWDECNKQIKGYSGAIYKSFSTLEEAKEFLGIASEDKNKSHSDAIAYVDGSFDESSKEFSYGVVMLYDEIEEHFSEKFNSSNLVGMRNVAGEIKGAEKAMQYCIDYNIKSIDIYYDYDGIAKWCTGEWKTNKEGTKAYKAFYDKIKSDVKVNFIKVVAHSGNKYNDLADQIAKSALGIGNCPQILENTNGMIANNIYFNDLVSIIDLLKDDIEDLNVVDCLASYGKGFTLSTKVPTKQKLNIIHFDTKNKLWIQGKKEDLFNRLSLYIVELLEVEEVPRFLNTVHNLAIDKDIVEAEFDLLFPNAKGKIPDKINNYLHQAVYNLKINGDLYDATFLVEPAIRPLEGILKIALLDNNIPIRDISNNFDSFFVFTKEKGKYVLKSEYIRPEHSNSFLEYLTVCYNHLKNHRHTLSHWDNPKDCPDTSRTINTTIEAHTLIKDTLKIIDSYYKL